jgi:thioredoxin-related protein
MLVLTPIWNTKSYLNFDIVKRLVVVLVLSILIVLQSLAQIDSSYGSIARGHGVSFERGLGWQEVLQKAQKENKYVFVDCYATWCGTCKRMERNIYPSDSVGSLMNDRYISVRMQMDSTTQDDDEIRRWYAIARAFEEKYHIESYPTYLFFSPDGQALHKAIGGESISDFLSIATAAMDPTQQYYTLLADWMSGKMNFTQMPDLANRARRFGEDSLSDELSRYFMHYYLETLPEEEMWTRDNILFVDQYSLLVNSTDHIFQLYCRNRTTVDSVMHDRYFADALINDVLYRDEIEPELISAFTGTGDEPRWHQLEERIAKNYGTLYAKMNVLQGQIVYYKVRKNWKKYVKCILRKEGMNSIENWFRVNRSVDLKNDAYEVFKYDNSKRELEKALAWVNRALAAADSLNPRTIDIKANLLYKLGKQSEGLALEEKSHTLLPRDRHIADCYEKMKNGLPTWPTK